MLKVYTFGKAWGMPDPSPFVLKLLVFLELADIPYETRAGLGYVRRAPKGKLPYIREGDQYMGDSELIIEHLNEERDHPLGDQMDAKESASLRGLTKMLDENLYFVMVYLRWADPDGWETYTRPNFFGNMKWPMSSILPNLLQRGVKKTLHGQGIARHTKEQIVDIGRKDLEAISDYLGDKAFIAGEEPCTADATVFSFVSAFCDAPHPSPLRDLVLNDERLMAYVNRMKARLPGLYPAPD